MSKTLSNQEKSVMWLAGAALGLEFIFKFPIFWVLIAYILYTISAGWFGWVLFALYIPIQIASFIVVKMMQKADKAVKEAKKDEQLEADSRFGSAKPVFGRGEGNPYEYR